MHLRRTRPLPDARLALVLLAASGLSLACGHAPPSPDAPGASAFYRQQLASSPSGDHALEYRDALEASEFADAKRKQTILSFRTFLSEFPDGPHQREARTRLEALRWNEASLAGTEVALQGFLADEPRGAHAGEAWALIAQLQLISARKEGTAAALRAWLEAHPAAAQRELAEQALAEAEFREATLAPLSQRRALLRALLTAHPNGARRAEAEALEARTAIDEAALLGDSLELRAWSRSGRADAANLLAQLTVGEAAARLDVSQLSEIAEGHGVAEGAAAERAQQVLDGLKKARPHDRQLIDAARTLYLPAPRGDVGELPQGPRERARALRQAALAIDGRALPALLAEFGSQQSFVAQSALAAALHLLESLPSDEAQVRAARASAALAPIAQDGPHLAALAVALRAQGDAAGALAAAQAGAARDPRSLVSQLIAAKLQVEADRATAPVAVKALLSAVRASLSAHVPASRGDAAPGAPTEGEAAPTLWALCASEAAAHAAVELLAPAPGADGKGVVAEDAAWAAARADADSVLAEASGAVARAERGVHKEGACRLEREHLPLDAEKLEQARAKAAAILLPAGDVVSEALARARLRDPSPIVRKLLATPAHAAAATMPP